MFISRIIWTSASGAENAAKAAGAGCSCGLRLAGATPCRHRMPMSVIIYYLLENVLPSAAAPSLEASAPLSHHSRIRRRVAGLSDPATNRSRTSGRRCRTGEDARSGYRRDTDSGERRRLRRAEPDRQQAGDPHPTALMFHVKHLYVYGHCREDGALACRRRGYFFPLRAEAMSPVKPWA